MFPEVAELEFNLEETETLPQLGKSFLFDFKKGEFVLKNGKMIELYGVDAIKMWIEKVIRTERFHFKIYEDIEYGVTLYDLIGSNYPQAFIESEIEREITSVLMEHSYINQIKDWEFIRSGTKTKIFFRVVMVDETMSMEVIL